jgi:hypothetical protein
LYAAALPERAKSSYAEALLHAANLHTQKHFCTQQIFIRSNSSCARHELDFLPFISQNVFFRSDEPEFLPYIFGKTALRPRFGQISGRNSSLFSKNGSIAEIYGGFSSTFEV